MAVDTIGQLVKTLIELGSTGDARLAQLDREDTTGVTYRMMEGQTDPLLAGGLSGLEFWTYLVTVRDTDGAAAETEARAIQDAINALAVNYAVDNWVVQSASTGSLTDEDRGEVAGDQFQYQYSFTLTLAIGRAS